MDIVLSYGTLTYVGNYVIAVTLYVALPLLRITTRQFEEATMTVNAVKLRVSHSLFIVHSFEHIDEFHTPNLNSNSTRGETSVTHILFENP